MPANFLESHFHNLSVEYILHLVKEGHLLLYGLGTSILVLCFWLEVSSFVCLTEDFQCLLLQRSSSLFSGAWGCLFHYLRVQEE